MQTRNFANFLDTYVDYAHSNFVPSQFDLWSGVSIVAGALERKVWLPWTPTLSYYPNMFIMLVSLPGVGKTTAINKALDLLLTMNERHQNIHFIPSQITDAKFIEVMGEARPFEHGSKIKYQSSGYYFASEASNTLKNIWGDFIACLTDFYDCPPFWEKATKKDGRITLRNVCLNLMAGSTFDYLGKLITDDNVMGGFASRITYVMYREKKVINQKFQTLDGVEDPARQLMREHLIQDLTQISKMVGPFKADPGFAELWEKWYPEFEERRQSMASEKMQSLLVRTNTSLMKLCMVLSACESNDRVLKPHHWERAQEMLTFVERDLPGIIRESRSSKISTQDGVNQAIFKLLEHSPTKTASRHTLEGALLKAGFSSNETSATIMKMAELSWLRFEGNSVRLLVNPNDHL